MLMLPLLVATGFWQSVSQYSRHQPPPRDSGKKPEKNQPSAARKPPSTGRADMNRRVQQFRCEAASRQPPPRRGQNPSSYDGQTAAAAVSSSSSHCLTLSLHYSHQTSSSLLPATTTPSTSPFYPLNYPLSHFHSTPHNPPTATDCGRCRCRYTSEPSQPAPLFFAPSSTTHSQRHGSSSTSSRERKKWNPRLSTLAKYGIIGNILHTLRDFPTLGTGGIAFTGEIFVS